MIDQAVTWILGILTTLFGGLNIFQWITLNSYKRLKSAEAYQSEIEALRAIIEENRAEIGRLSQRLEACDRREIENNNRYDVLYQKYDALRDEFEEYKLKHK